MAFEPDPIDGAPIVRRCLDHGFATAGVCAARASAFVDEYSEWISKGRHGAMAYLERNVQARLDPTLLVPGARSVIMVTDQYHVRADASRRSSSAGHGRIARYAQGRDYHVVMKKRLHALCDALRAEHPDHAFRAFVDTAPVLEREHAARAGLGWVGKHTLLIDPRLGSYLFLGGVLTTLPIRPPEDQSEIEDHCGTCTRCIDACPTGAITPYSVDAKACISYLTIENRGEIESQYFTAMGDWLFGCDVCQEVCPHNSPRDDRVDVGERQEAYAPVRETFDLLEVLAWSEDDRRRALQGSAMKRANLDMLRRNATIAASNEMDEDASDALRRRIAEIREDEDESPLTRAAASRINPGE